MLDCYNHWLTGPALQKPVHSLTAWAELPARALMLLAMVVLPAGMYRWLRKCAWT